MGLIRQADAMRVAQQAVVLDLGDLRRHADTITAEAKANAARIVERAQAERVKLVASGHEEGRKAGYEQGLAEGRAAGKEQGRTEALAAQAKQIEAVNTAWNAAIKSFADERDAMMLAARQDVLRLAAVVAEKVTKRVCLIDPRVVEAQIEAVLKLVSRRTRLVIAVHPDDQTAARDVLPKLVAALGGDLAHAEITADAALARGSCVVRTGSSAAGVVDASIDTQLDRIVEALLPGVSRTELMPPAAVAPSEATGESSPAAPPADGAAS